VNTLTTARSNNPYTAGSRMRGDEGWVKAGMKERTHDRTGVQIGSPLRRRWRMAAGVSLSPTTSNVLIHQHPPDVPFIVSCPRWL
jgi:hypothetical protein